LLSCIFWSSIINSSFKIYLFWLPFGFESKSDLFISSVWVIWSLLFTSILFYSLVFDLYFKLSDPILIFLSSDGLINFDCFIFKSSSLLCYSPNTEGNLSSFNDFILNLELWYNSRRSTKSSLIWLLNTGWLEKYLSLTELSWLMILISSLCSYLFECFTLT